MFTIVVICCVFAVVSGQEECKPGENCELPNCRCWFDPEIPGGFVPEDTPQIVMVTFEDAVHAANVETYRTLFQENNPNGCPARGTFFIKDLFTDYTLVRSLYDEGHEVGANSIDGTIPANSDEWKILLQNIKNKFADVGISGNDVHGVRGPELRAGGLDEFIGIGETGYNYDATCSTIEFVEKENIMWPYTYNFVPSPGCTSGSSPDVPFPGKWQFLLPAMTFNGVQCVTASACVGLETQRDVFNLFFDSFNLHYEGNRAPFIMVIPADFVLVEYKRAGVVEFLQFVRAAFDDTWILPVYKGLQWVQNPTMNVTTFGPWEC